MRRSGEGSQCKRRIATRVASAALVSLVGTIFTTLNPTEVIAQPQTNEPGREAEAAPSAPSVATDRTTTAALPEGVGPLPDFRKGAKVGVYVTREHTDKYREILPPELADLVDQGLFAFEVARVPKQEISVPASWSTPALKEPPGERGAIVGEPPAEVGSFLYSAPSTTSSTGETKEAAYAVLWNSTVHSWMWKSWGMDADFTFIREPKRSARTVRLSFERLYPRALGASPGELTPFFREKISLKSPAALQGLNWLTLRFFDEDDYLWASSPLSGNVRQMTASNRSDSLFTGAFSPDDLWVWSGKVKAVDPTSMKLVQVLVPVVDQPWGTIATSEGCTSLTPSKSGEVQLNSDTVRFPDLPGWVPTNAIFVPRSVWKIELSSLDPFSLDARQTLYVDAESMLPVYRAVWDEGGRLRRFTMGIVGTVVVDGRSTPTWRGQLMVSPSDSTRSTLLPTQLSVCGKLVDGRDLKAFDPSTLVDGKRAENTSSGASEKSPTSETGGTSSQDELIEDPEASAGE